ncbi:hypothetical protein ABC733_04995 [Mangrovibacter sp. SLW1]
MTDEQRSVPPCLKASWGCFSNELRRWLLPQLPAQISVDDVIQDVFLRALSCHGGSAPYTIHAPGFTRLHATAWPIYTGATGIMFHWNWLLNAKLLRLKMGAWP